MTKPWMLRLSLMVCLSGGAGVYAQGSVRYFGTSCGLQPPLGSPKILVSGPLKAGSILQADLLNMGMIQVAYQCWFSGRACLAIGASQETMAGAKLPIQLPFNLTAGWPCHLHTSTDFLDSSVGGLLPWPGAGATRAAWIPNSAALVGQKVYLQWIVYYGAVGLNCLPWGAGLWYYVTSDAAEVTIGK